MSRRPIAAACLTATASLLAAGCGAATQTSSGNFHGEQRNVAKVVDDLSTSAGSTDAKHICAAILSPALVARLERGGGCEAAVRRQAQLSESVQATVEAVTISGSNATARVKGLEAGKDRRYTVLFTREGASWRVAGLAR